MTEKFRGLFLSSLLLILASATPGGAQDGTGRVVIQVRGGDAGPVMDLEACVAQALSTNDNLQAERLRMEELDGQMDQALSTGLPTLDLVGNWTRSRSPAMALDETFGGGGAMAPPTGSPDWFNQWLLGFGSLLPDIEDIPAQSFLTTSLNLNWTINPMKIGGAVGAARLGIDRQELNERAVEHATTEEVMVAYWGIIRAAEQVEAVRAQLVNQTELLDIMRMRFDLGLVTRLDTLQAAVALANTKPRLEVARAELRNSGAHLNSLMGLEPGSPLAVVNDFRLELQPLRDEVALLLARRRPELRAAETFTDILRRNRKAQKAENMPYLNLAGSYGYIGKEFDSVFDAGHDSWSVAATVTVPIFDGMLNRGLVSQTEAQIRRTETEVQGQRRQVQVQVLDLLANLRLARGLLDAVTLNLENAEEVLEESLLMLELGKTRYLDVLVAEANRTEARSNVIAANNEVLTLTAGLKRALGYSPLTRLQDIPNLVAEVSR